MNKVEAWKCDWCGKTCISKGGMATHEAACKKNPARRHCITCVHGTNIDWEHPVKLKEALTVESYMPGHMQQIEEYAGPWCDHHCMPINQKPYFIECATKEYPDGDAYPVPGTCDCYEYKGHAGWDKPKGAGT